MGHLAGVETSSELRAALWPLMAGAGTAFSTQHSSNQDGSLAWPPPGAGTATVVLQLSQRLSEGTLQHLLTKASAVTISPG